MKKVNIKLNFIYRTLIVEAPQLRHQAVISLVLKSALKGHMSPEKYTKAARQGPGDQGAVCGSVLNMFNV